jgi:prephenate dehydratase
MALRVAYFGPAGTYTEAAALQYAPQGELLPFPTIAAVYQAVAEQRADEGVLPIENSLEGSVNITLDLLISRADLSISHEIVLPIDHCLMVRPGTEVAAVRVIYSHPQSLAQCRGYLERNFPQAQATASLSNSAAVADMQASPVTAAAIAPQRAAELYGAEIVDRGIQDSPNNVTRFVVLARADHEPTGQDKTSICFSFNQDSPGVLYDALGVFAQRKINLAKIESRPTRESLGRYNFLIDIEGHRTEPLLREALLSLGQQVSLLKVLGSYPRWNPQQPG